MTFCKKKKLNFYFQDFWRYLFGKKWSNELGTKLRLFCVPFFKKIVKSSIYKVKTLQENPDVIKQFLFGAKNETQID